MKNTRQKPKNTLGKRFDATAYKNRSIDEIKTYQLELPSGFIFTVRRPNLRSFAASGRMPQSLLEAMLAAESSGATEIKSGTMSSDELAELIKFNALLVRKACVVPRIVENPTSPEEVRFEDIDDDDFLFLSRWCNGGGVEGENFEKFRNES